MHTADKALKHRGGQTAAKEGQTTFFFFYVAVLNILECPDIGIDSLIISFTRSFIALHQCPPSLVVVNRSSRLHVRRLTWKPKPNLPKRKLAVSIDAARFTDPRLPAFKTVPCLLPQRVRAKNK